MYCHDYFKVMNLLPLMLEFRSQKRGYRISVVRDLLGDTIVECHWFGQSNCRGGKQRQVFNDVEDANFEVQRVIRARLRHGHTLVERITAAS